MITLRRFNLRNVATRRLHEKGDKRRTIGLHFQASQAAVEDFTEAVYLGIASTPGASCHRLYFYRELSADLTGYSCTEEAGIPSHRRRHYGRLAK